MSVAQNKQTNKNWLCAESMVYIKSVNSQSISIPSNSRYSFTDTSSFSFSQVVYVNSNVANDCYLSIPNAAGIGIMLAISNTSIKLFINGSSNGVTYTTTTAGKQYYIVGTYNGTTKELSLYVNNIFMGRYINSEIFELGLANIEIGKCTQNSSYTNIDGSVGFLSIYNKELSAAEVNYLYNEISIVPKSLHTNCVGFWTCQERYGDKVYDSVEQFNYAKGSVLSANNGSLIGYTGTELGTTDKNTQTSRVDFYTKSVVDRWGTDDKDAVNGLLDIENAWRVRPEVEASDYWLGNYAPSNVPAPSIDLTKGWSVVISMKGYTSGQSLYFIAFSVSSTVFTFAQPGAAGDQYFLKNVAISETDLNTYSISVSPSGKATLGINGVFYYIDNVPFTDNASRGWIILGNENNVMTGGGHIARVGIWERPLENAEIAAIHNNSLFKNPNLSQQRGIWNYWLFNNFESGKIKSLFGTPKLELTPLSGAANANELNPAHADYALKPINTLR